MSKLISSYLKFDIIYLPERQIATNFIYLFSSNFVTISHINYWDQVNCWKNVWKFWNVRICRNKSGPFPLLSVAACSKSRTTEAFARTLSQILANIIDNGGEEFGLRIYVRYCRFILIKINKSFKIFIKWFSDTEY